MLQRTVKIDEYAISHGIFDVGEIDKILFNQIDCYSAGFWEGVICFWEEKDHMPKSLIVSEEFQFNLHFQIDRYQEIIETLRYEKPVFVKVNWDENTNIINSGYVTTSVEPIGEQEGQSKITKPILTSKPLTF